MLRKGQMRLFCLILGLVNVTLIGFLQTGIYLQATLFHLGLFAALWFSAMIRDVPFTKYHYVLLASGSLLSVFFTITTNTLIAQVNTFTVWIITSLLLLLLFERRSVDTPIVYIQSGLRFLFYSIGHGISITTIKEFFSLGKIEIKWRPNREIVWGTFISLPILLIFHLLFARVNAEYASFINKMFEEIWRFIRFIIDIDILWIILKGTIEGYLLYILLTVEHTKEQEKQFVVHWPLMVMKTVLALVIVLFFVFSTFQSKLLLLDIFRLAFKEVSQYVQKGFAELLVVSAAGYIMSFLVLKKIQGENSQTKQIKVLLTIYCIELIAVTVFLFHKLYALQAVFGFKDQRLLATGAVSLILISFILLIFRIWHHITSVKLFRLQVLLLAGLMIGLSFINLDLFVSRYNSIRYISHDKIYKDYSYLLGNSYDNVNEWPKLIAEAQETGIPTPDPGYYWGHFSQSRKDFYGSRYSPIYEIREERTFVPNSTSLETQIKQVCSTYLEEHFNKPTKKYSTFSIGKTPIKIITTFNLHEWQAYQFIQNNKATVDTFITFIKTQCSHDELTQ